MIMRLPGKEIKQCHSLSVGHGVRDESLMRPMPGKKIKQCHSLPVDHVG